MMKQILCVVGGAAIGGLVGYYVFFWLVGHNLYGLALPGGLLGVGAGMTKHRSLTLAIVCGVAALALGLFTQWQFEPFAKDESFSYFLTHVADLEPITLIMIALGGVIGFWGPFRQIEPAKPGNTPSLPIPG